MRRSLIRSTCAAIALIGTLAPSWLAAETLRDAMVGAYTHSGLLDQNRALLRAADEDVAQAVAALKPILSYSASATATNSSFTGTTTNALTAALNAQMLLWDGGRTQISIDIAKEAVLATRQTLISVEQQVLLNAVSAYFNVRQAAENVALRQSNVRLIGEELRAAEDRFDVGEVTRTDVAQAESRLAEASSGLAAAQGQLTRAREEYANVVGRRPGTLAAPRGLPQLEPNAEAAKAVALRTHPDLKQVQHQVTAAEMSIERARRATLPTVNLTGSLSNTEQSGEAIDQRQLRVGVDVSGTIYSGGALTSAARQAVANRDAARGSLHTARHTITRNVGFAYADLQAANAQLAATEERIRAARVAFRGVREEASLGSRTTLDVLNAEQSLLDAQAARITAEATRFIAAYQVLATMGLLTAKNMGLGVQLYDAEEYYNLVKSSPTPRSEQGRKLDRVLEALQKE